MNKLSPQRHGRSRLIKWCDEPHALSRSRLWWCAVELRWLFRVEVARRGPGFVWAWSKVFFHVCLLGKCWWDRGCLLNVSATCSPPPVHAGHLEAVAVLTTGCLLNVVQLHLRWPCVRQEVCWPHIELDSGVSPLIKSLGFLLCMTGGRFAESHNSRLFQQCVKLQVLGIACSYRAASLCFSICGPMTSISRAIEHGTDGLPSFRHFCHLSCFAV